MAAPEQRDAFGIIVSYAVKVKLFLGALGGELSAELPFVLMHPKVSYISGNEILHYPGKKKFPTYSLELKPRFFMQTVKQM